MEKKQSLLNSEQFKKKLAKLSPRERATVRRRILEGEEMQRKHEKEEEALMRLPKEERLKAICSDYIGMTVDVAKGLGKMFGSGVKETTGEMTRDLKQQMRFALTMALKKAKVLPLGN